MKSRQFSSKEEAISYCKSVGTFKNWGRAGKDLEYAVCTLIIGNMVYHIDVYDDGLVKLRHERYKHQDE